MRKQVCRIVAAAVLLLSSAAVAANAQQATFKIPFEFRVEKKTLPAGIYTVTYGKSDSKALTLRDKSSGATFQAPILTRLAVKDPSDPDAHLVFDKVDEEHSLAEFWQPGLDGFFLGGAMTTHTHVILHAEK